MTLLTYTAPARVNRRVSVSPSGVLAVDDTVGPWFPGQIIDTRGGSRNDEPSPRSRPVLTFRFFDGVLGPVGPSLGSGDRVGVRATVYELLEDPHLVSDGEYAFEVPIQNVQVLYPLLGELQEMDGTPVVVTSFAAYAPRETHEARGTYEDYTIDAPINVHAEVRNNRQFATGTDIYKINAATVDKVGGYVSVNARRAGRG